MKGIALAGALVAIAVGCNGNNDGELRSDCLQVRDKAARFAVQQSARGHTGKRYERELAKHQQNIAASFGERFIETCKSRGDAYVHCALAASSRAELEACQR